MPYLAMDDYRHHMAWDAYCVYVHGITAEYLSLDYQIVLPTKLRRYTWQRGVRIFCGYTWTLPLQARIHQCQAPGTLDHTFRLPRFPAGTQVWYRIIAAAGLPAGGRSVSPIFHVLIPDCPDVPALIGARIRSTAPQFIPFDTLQPLTFNVEVFDYGGMANLGVANNRLTIPETGLYLINAGCSFPNVAISHVQLELWLEPITRLSATAWRPTLDHYYKHLNLSTLFYFTVGQQVGARIWTPVVGGINTLVWEAAHPYLAAFRVPGSP